MRSRERTLVDDLRRLLRRGGDSVVREGESILADIFSSLDSVPVSELVSLFEDDSDYDEIMWSIVHGIEVLPAERYAVEICAAASELWQASREWAEVLFLRALRDPPTLLGLQAMAPTVEHGNRQALREILDQIAQGNTSVSEVAGNLAIALSLP